MAFSELDKITRNELTPDLDKSIGKLVTIDEWKAMIASGEITDSSVEVYNIVDDVEVLDTDSIAESVLTRVEDMMSGKYYTADQVNNKIDPIESDISKIKSIVQSDGSIRSQYSNFVEISEWDDNNPTNEDRVGYFVSINTESPDAAIVKSNSNSIVRGVTVINPAFISNATVNKFDSDGTLKPAYSYVCPAGLVSIIDKGHCIINGYCMPDDDGTAKPSETNYGYHVISRIDSNHILISIEPQGDVIKRIMDEISHIDTPEEVVVSDTEPTSSDARLWVNPNSTSDIQLAELSDVRALINTDILKLSVDASGNIQLPNSFNRLYLNAIVVGYISHMYIDNEGRTNLKVEDASSTSVTVHMYWLDKLA